MNTDVLSYHSVTLGSPTTAAFHRNSSVKVSAAVHDAEEEEKEEEEGSWYISYHLNDVRQLHYLLSCADVGHMLPVTH